MRRGRTVLLVGLLLFAALDAATLPPRLRDLSDFGSFVASGRAAAHGQDPYAAYALTHAAVVEGAVVRYANLNPPVWLFLFEWLARGDPARALAAWRIVSAVLYLLALIVLARTHRDRMTPLLAVWALSLPGLYDTLASGQVYVLVLAAVVGAAACLQRGRLVAGGVCLGIAVAMRPNLAVWPVVLLLAGHRRVPAAALATAAMLSALPVVRYGPGVYAQWWDAASAVTWGRLPHNASLFGLTARCGLSGLGLPLAVSLLGGLAVWAWARRPSLPGAGAAAVCAALLAAPVAWSTSVLLLLPAFFAARWSRTVTTAAVLLAVPTVLVLGLGARSYGAAIVLGALYPLGLLLLLADSVRGAGPASPPGG